MISSRVLASLIGAYALAIVLVAPPVSYAQSVAAQPTVAVRYADLNLDTHSGVKTLFSRIQTAADEVCQQYGPQGSLIPSAAHRSCTKDAVAAAVRKVDSPRLTAYYSERDDRHSLNTASR
jgi:UrcA family protein